MCCAKAQLVKVADRDRESRRSVTGSQRAGQLRRSLVGAHVSLLTGTPSYLSVEALRDSELFVLQWSELNALYARHACFQSIGRRLTETLLTEREARAHELLTLSASKRYARFRQTYGAPLPEFRGYDIASYLGITPFH